MRERAGVCEQTRLLLWKNALEKRRNPWTLLSEVMLPVVGALILILIRSAVVIKTTEQSYNLQYNRSIVDPFSLLQTFDTIGCGETVDTNRVGSAPAFGIAGGTPEIRDALDLKLRLQYNAAYSLLATLANASQLPLPFKPDGAFNCTGKSWLCLIPINFDKPECKEESVTPTNILQQIARPNFIKKFETRGEMEAYCKTDGYGKSDENPQLHYGVSFQASPQTLGGQGSWDYAIHSNISFIPNPTRATNDLIVGFNNGNWQKYIQDGFMFFQAQIDAFILADLDLEQILLTTKFVPFPVPSYKTDQFAQYLSALLGLFLIIFYMWPFSRLVTNIVEEKEKRIREGMKIMGLRSSAFWLSWALTYIFMMTVVTVAVTIAMIPVFPYSNAGLVFAVFWLFGMSLVPLGLLVSVFFSQAKTAGLVSVFALFVLFLPSFNVSGDNVSLQIRTISSLSSPTAFALVMTEILNYEAAFVGIQMDNFMETDNGYSIQIALIAFTFDFFIYAFLAWYFDQVWPGELGTHERPWFLCTPRYWCKSTVTYEDPPTVADEIGAEIQPVPDNLASRLGVEITGLRKEFKDQIAVHGLNLNLYEGQILVLLGHNGAGKTTTINMLTGMLPTSGGTAKIYGKDVRYDMKDIRSNLGFCPQHNILFNNLTVKEHLLFYGELKGVPKEELESVVTVSIAEIQLELATNQRSCSLSGGQKRRLSLAISLIGGSKVVFLDEPTSGVDPFSRRAIWDLLNKKKHDRVMILTTHFMDEADQLGDRIAIMHHGRLRCVGTSLFLKNVFGVGYNIVMSRKPDADRKALGDLIIKHVEKAELLSDVGTELAYRLPLASSAHFPAMLVDLEQKGEKIGIENFGLSVTTMEEVFLRVASEMADKNDTTEMGASIKRLHSKNSEVKEKIKSRKSSEEIEQKKMIKRNSSVHEEMLKAEANHATGGRHMKALLWKRFKIATRDRKQQCCQFGAPMILLLVGLFLLSQPTLQQLPDIKLHPADEYTQYGQSPPVPINQEYRGQTVHGADYVGPQAGCAFVEVNKTLDTLQQYSQYLLDTRTDSKLSRYGAFFVEGQFLGSGRPFPPEQLPLRNGSVAIYTNITGLHAIPTFWSILSTGHLRFKNGNDQDSILVTTAVWPWTVQQNQAISAIKGLFTSIILALSLAFIPSSYVAFTVKERSSKAKHLQFISGVSPTAYWLSNYVFDFITFLLPAFGTILLLIAFKEDAYTGKNLPIVFLNLMLYGLAVIPFSYLFSFLFESHTIAQGVMILVYIFAGVVLLITSFVFYSIESVAMYADTIRYFFRLFPNFCMGDCVFYLSIVSITNEVSLGDATITGWDMQISGWDSVFLSIEAVVFFALVLLIEHYSAYSGELCSKSISPELLNRGINRVEDPDVEAEKSRILEGHAKKDLVTLQGLRKAFSQKVAVNDLFFSIPQNQCFGFLGVNGAGKSTTLKMMTGDEVPTQGDAFISGLSILQNPVAVRKLMGYCPQFDALHDLLTAEEHLALYASIRGVPSYRMKEMISWLADKLTLSQDNQHKRVSKTYSGGNKRKLSVGIALIGNPPVVFLDEPSTGMDPVSRRFMWDFITETMANRAVILTTHSMEECEALCSRIGILVHGRLKCIGSGQHLKTRFGMGFEFLLNVKDDRVDDVREFIKKTFEGANELECYGGNMKYQLGKQQMKLSELFRLLEENKEQMGITEYSIGQTTLEQIFIRFASDGDAELAREAAGGLGPVEAYHPPSYVPPDEDTKFVDANAIVRVHSSKSSGSHSLN